MKIETREPLKRWVSLIVENVLPRGLRQQYMDESAEYCSSLSQFVPDSAVNIAGGYWIQAIAAFNKTLALAQTGAVMFSFAAAGFPLRFCIIFGSIFGALTLRDAYTHPHNGSYLDSAADALAAGVSLFLSEALMLTISPSLAVPDRVLYRGAFVCVPLLFTLRMVLRQRDPKNPFEGSKMTAKAMYNKVWWLNIVWMAAVIGTILIGTPLMPAWFPEFLRGSVPVLTFKIWLVLQRNSLVRHDKIQKLFEDQEKKTISRLIETLAKGLSKREPFYWAYRCLEPFFFFQLATPSAVTLWPWLSGRPAEIDVFLLAFNLTAFATLLLSWNYVKAANRAAAEALQREIDRETAKTPPASP